MDDTIYYGYRGSHIYYLITWNLRIYKQISKSDWPLSPGTDMAQIRKLTVFFYTGQNMSLVPVHSGYLPTMYGCFGLKMVFESFLPGIPPPPPPPHPHPQKGKNGEDNSNCMTQGILTNLVGKSVILRLRQFDYIFDI